MPRRNQTNTNSVINEEGNEPKRNLITFNYSESLNRIIELNTENYKGWSWKILYLLLINKLTKYVMKQEIKKFRKKTFTGNPIIYRIGLMIYAFTRKEPPQKISKMITPQNGLLLIVFLIRPPN